MEFSKMLDLHCRNIFETFLATHCAPVLLGKKSAALFSASALPGECSWVRIRQYGFKILYLHRLNLNSLVLIYHPKLLRNCLESEIVHHVLKEIGYPVHKKWQAMLGFLSQRFRESEEFPHEVGFFLGYPPEDVIGFMDCPYDCKLCGSWKVYGDVGQASLRFAEYNRCRELLLNHIQNGGSIFSSVLPVSAG